MAGISITKPEAIAPSQARNEFLPQVEELKYLGGLIQE